MARLAVIAARQQQIMRRLKAELDALLASFQADPRRLAQETQRLFASEGVSMLPTTGCLGALVQVPIFLALFGAVRQVAAGGGRFAWIRDIARPDTLLAVVVAVSRRSAWLRGRSLKQHPRSACS